MNEKTPDEQANIAARNARSFSVFLSELEYGATEKDLSVLKAKICEALSEHQVSFGGNPEGSLSLNLKFQMEGGMVMIVPTIEHKLPRRPRQKTAFFMTRDNDLSRSDPRQRTLPLEVAGGKDVKSA